MKRSPFLLFPLFLVLYEFTVYLANDMIMPAMVSVAKEFGAESSTIPLSLTAYLIGGSALQLVLGPISDSYGRRRIMLIGAFSFLIWTILSVFTSSMEQFMLTRFLQGTGICFITVVGYASIQEMFEEKEAIRLTALMAIVSLVAPLVGPLAGGIYAEYFPWQGIFIITGILAVIAFIGLFFHMPETAHLSVSPKNIPQFRPDLSQLPPLNLRSSLKNYRQIFSNPVFIVGSLSLSVSVIPLLAWISISPVILITEAGLSPAQYGFCQIPIFGALMLGNIFLRKAISKISAKKVISVGSIVIFIGLLACGVIPLWVSHPVFSLVPALSFYAVGVAIANAALVRVVLFSSEVAKGTVSAVMSLIHSSMFAAGTYCMSIIYKTHDDFIFGLFCAAIGVIYIFLLLTYFYFRRKIGDALSEDLAASHTAF